MISKTVANPVPNPAASGRGAADSRPQWLASLGLVALVFTAGTAAAALPASPVARVGSCPSGYTTSGDYCLATSDDSRHALPRQGSCPSGYTTSGDYCLSTR